MVKTSTTKDGIVIHGIKQLTDVMLAQNIASGLTLAKFLETKCKATSNVDCIIYTTKNYSFFKCLEENRLINEAHVQSLMESFEKDGYLFTILYLNEKMEIIDGQHRYEAAKRMELPIHFMVMPKWSIREVTTLNVNSRNWTIIDFMEAHAKSGNPNYVRFKEFYDAHDFEVTVCQLIITGSRTRGHAAIDKFRSGLMQVDDQQVTDAFLKAKKIQEFALYHSHGWKSRNFVEAVLALCTNPKYNHQQMMSKLKMHPDILLAEAKLLRVEEYLRILLDKYNFRMQKNRLEIVRR